jgi:Pentapeptide repeats (8 copies)
METHLLIFLDSFGWPATVSVGVLILVAVPAWLVIKWYIKPETPEQKKDAVTLLFQILGGAAFLVGVYFTWQQLLNSRDMLITTQQGQITERFTRAIEQLGKEDEDSGQTQGAKAGGNSQKNLAIRLGGIYALEHLAKDYQSDHTAVMEVLTAFVRQHSAWAEGAESADASQRDIRLDTQAILTVIGRRQLTYNNGESQRLNLSGTDLRWAVLNNANFNGVDFTSAHLEKAELKGAELRESILLNAYLNEAILEGAQLQGADLRGAVFRNAKVTGVNFNGADLRGADLTSVEGLTQQQLDSAKTDGATQTNLRTAGTPSGGQR